MIASSLRSSAALLLLAPAALSAALPVDPSAPSSLERSAALAGSAVVEEPFVDLELPSALARAEKNDQLVLLYFNGEKDPASRRMREETFKNADVRAWVAKHAIALEIPQSDLKTCGRFDVDTYPQVVLLRSDGRMLYRMHDFKDPSDFLLEVQIALIGTGDVHEPTGDDADDPIAWLAWANWLFANAPERSDEATDAYLWCLDHGDEYMENFRERHLEFILERLSYLKGRTQKAIDGLFVRRADLYGHITAGIGTPRQAYEYCRFNYWLRDQDETVQLFADLGDKETEAHEACRRVLLREELRRIVDYQHYDAVLAMVPDPLATIDSRLRAYDKQLAQGEADPAERAKIIDDAASYYECLLHAGRGADAKELLDRVVSKIPTGRAYFAFLERAQHLSLFDLARKIADEGLEKVQTPKGKKMLTLARRRIPTEKGHDKGTLKIPTKGEKSNTEKRSDHGEGGIPHVGGGRRGLGRGVGGNGVGGKGGQKGGDSKGGDDKSQEGGRL